MFTKSKQFRTHLLALAFVSVLLVLVYGPLAQWFVGADRFLYDRLATHLPSRPLDGARIISIDSSRISNEQLITLYGQIVAALRAAQVRRIVLTQPPTADGGAPPDWIQRLEGDVPVYMPSRHPYAKFATRTGFVDVQPDDDEVLRRSDLWQLHDGVMSPSLPLAIAFDNGDDALSKRLSNIKDAIYLSNYAEVSRIEVADLANRRFDRRTLAGATVFLDHAPALVGAAAVLPSGQYVTQSEIVAATLGAIEHDRLVTAPIWAKALGWLAPLLLAGAAVMLLPGRSRKDILKLTASAAAGALLLEILMLYVLHVRLDLGRPVLLFFGVAILSVWLVTDVEKKTQDAFKRGSDFLAAGRLEPAFAEFRRCPPSEMLSSIMYKLSLAFEEQAKPERAEAVLDWLKRTHSSLQEPLPGKDTTVGIPQRLGRYVIERRIGRGAMGAVYLAKDPRINRPVAVKAIPIAKEFEDDELKEARLRFYREAESAGRLTHPNIITVYDAGEEKGMAYIAMEYVAGVPLTKFTDPTRLLAPKRALELCAMTADALHYAHSQGVIHRDIKPANLLYNSKDGLLKITDFGVARLTDNNKTKTGIVLGTPMYMSPEQLAAEDLTGHSDLFSLGVTLYELLLGEVPFQATNIAVLMTKITTEDPAPVSTRRAGIPPSVDSVLARALSKRPEERFENGAELAAALRECARYV